MTTAPAFPAPEGPGPAEPARREHRRARWLVPLVLAVALALVWALGGFRGGALLVPARVGETLHLGPMDFVAIDARAARSTYSTDWVVQVHGTCTAIDPGGVKVDLFNSDNVVMADDVSRDRRVFAEDYSTSLLLDTDRQASLQRTALGPGLGPMPCAFQARMPESFTPGSGLLFGLARMDFRDTSVTGDQDPVWTPGAQTYRLNLPVVEVAQL